MEPFKTFDVNRNGMVLGISVDVLPTGMHQQVQNMDFNAGAKMDRGGTDPSVFDNNGGNNKAIGAGTINKNGEYGPVTTGF